MARCRSGSETRSRRASRKRIPNWGSHGPSAGPRTTRESGHITETRCPAESNTVGCIDGEESEHPLHPQARPTRVAQVVGLQQAQYGRERDLSIQADHRPSYEESYSRGPTCGGATRMQGSQHDDQSWDACQLPGGVNIGRGSCKPALSREPCNNAASSRAPFRLPAPQVR